MAHWALFVPSADDPNFGKVIHVKRDRNPDKVFTHDFKRNHNTNKPRSPHQLIELGQITSNIIVDVPGNGREKSWVDKTPVDILEQIALTIPGPRPSLNSALAPVCIDLHPFTYYAY
jgi:hypothetical protein